MRLKRISTLLAAAAVALAGCDGDGVTDPGDLDFGTWQGEVTGEFDRNLQGAAFSFNTPGFGQDQISLITSSGDAEIFVIHLDDDFREGRTTLVNGTGEADSGVFAAIYFEQSDRLFIATNGVLELDVVDNDGLTGTISFDAVEAVLFDDGSVDILDEEVSVDASFQTEYSGSSSLSRLQVGGAAARLQKAPAN